MKFGGAAVASPEQFSKIADIIISRQQLYSRIAVVVSAMGNTTNHLIELAKKVHPNPPRREYDMLVTAGERISIALLAMALNSKQKDAVSFTGSQSGILTCARHSEARIVDVKPYRIEESLNEGKIVIVAGFQGVSKVEKQITSLGRGGSDTSAVALGVALGAEKVEFFKDVEGIYDRDPKICTDAHLYSKLSYDSALEIAAGGAKVLHDRSIQLAKKNGIVLYVFSFNESSHHGTVIGEEILIKQPPQYEEG